MWEWRSDTYVLKQQGHYFDISAVAFSPDGALVATGSDDRKVRQPCCNACSYRLGQPLLLLQQEKAEVEGEREGGRSRSLNEGRPIAG